METSITKAAKDILAVFMTPDNPRYQEVLTAIQKRLHKLKEEQLIFLKGK